MTSGSLVGTRIGRYRFVASIGAGAMGEVYRASDIDLGREAALKILPADVVADTNRLARFRREAQLLASLSHPNIAVVYGLEESGDLHCLAMELVPGATLADRVARGALPVAEVLGIAAQVADALEAAHRQRVTHRDIKPANIKVTPEGRVKVLDFGLAKSIAGEEAESASTITALTEPGAILGTPAYMSPEQLRGRPVHVSGDIWAFGCVTYELLSGRKPFWGASVAEVMAAVLTREPDWGALPATTPGQILDLLRRCLAKDPAQRLATMADARAAIQSALAAPAPVDPDRSVRSVVVLPFVNANADPQTEYLSDGLTESIIFSLSQLPRLSVIARSTAFRYKGRTEEPRDLGRTLGVAAVITGRVLERGGQLVVSAEMIDVAHGWQLWGRQHRKPSTDLLDLEESLASEICDALRLKLSADERKVLEARPTHDADAHRLYLQGRFFWGKRTEEGLLKGIQYFRRAIEADPMYALAYAGMAEGYVPLAFYGHVAPRDAWPKARAAANAALEIDPRLAEALTVLAAVKACYDFDPPGAERDLRAALDANASYPRALQGMAEWLVCSGRPAEATSFIKRALDNDPLSLSLHAAVGMIQFLGRQYDDGIEHCRRAVEMDASFYPARWFMALALERQGRFAEAADEIERARALSQDSTHTIASHAAILAAWGKSQEARALLAHLEALRPRRYVAPTLVAIAQLNLGDREDGLATLERAWEERCSWFRTATVDPRLDVVRGDSRFEALVGRLGAS